MPTALDLKKEEWLAYRPSQGLVRLREKIGPDSELRKREAFEIARKAAELLKVEFSADNVVLFGSLAHDEWYGPWSDIDLAVWG